MNRALFVDLDGTLITTRSGREFPIHSEDWKFIDETVDCICYHYKKNYKIIIVTNQGGIEEGYIVEKAFLTKINKICETLEKLCKIKPNEITYEYCRDMISYYRKPNPGMAFSLAVDYELNLRESIMIGDFKSDREFAKNAGIGDYKDVTEVQAIEWKYI